MSASLPEGFLQTEAGVETDVSAPEDEDPDGLAHRAIVPDGAEIVVPTGHHGGVTDPEILDSFAPATKAWFQSAFPAPTAAQEGAWRAIASGENALVVAPTGSGKTLAAFLWSLDRLASTETPSEEGAAADPLRVTSEGAGGRRRAQPPVAARRDQGGGTAPGASLPGCRRRGPDGRHTAGRETTVRIDAARHPDHDARIAVPAAHVGSARGARHRSTP